MSREAYFCSEGRPHYNEDDLCGYTAPYARDLTPIPPTLITYNVNITQTYDVKEIQDYATELFENKMSNFIQELSELALAKMQENLNLSAQNAVELAFSELTHIYGGSATELINGGKDNE